MRRRKNVGRVLAGILAVGLLVSSVPSAVYATENESGTTVVAEQETVVPEENGEEAGQESAGTEPVGKEDNETGEETADPTDTTPEEEDKENQEEIEADSEQTEEDDEVEDVETEVEADVKGVAAEVMEADEAEMSGSCGENLTWKYKDGVLTISGAGSMDDYSDYIDDRRSPWYKYKDVIESVIIEDSVTTIGEYAFGYCSSLTNIEIPTGVTSIGEWAFEGCTSLTSIEIPSGVIDIAKGVFFRCSGLKNIEIPSEVTSIGSCAFEGCYSLTGIELPSGVTSIGSYAFLACTRLTSIEIPAGVTSIGERAFEDCERLTSIEIPSGVTSIGECAFERCTRLTGIEIPAGVASIEGGTFRLCSSLTSIEIPAGVTSIGSHAFERCYTLTSIEIPSGVTSIGAGAFEGCERLTSIEIPLGVTTIERDVFNGCSSLTSIEIPLGVTTIEINAFSDCSNLSDVYYGGSESEWLSITIGNSNDPLTTATIHYNHAGPIPKREYKVYINYPGYEIFDISLDHKVKKTRATTYDPQLAHMLIAMCNSVHNENDMKATFDSFGFAADYRTLDYSLKEVLLAYGLGIKLMDDGTVLVLVVARGTEGLGEDFAEWWSNIAKVGTNSLGEHTGFSDAASGLFDIIREFLNTKGKRLKPGLDTENFSDIKFVLTGHSRGAAAVNIVGKRLSDLRNGEDENIYVYTFACPDVAVITDAHAAKYPTIFNIANVRDLVPWAPRAVMPDSGERDGWGKDSYWNKYGYSYWFCDNWDGYSRDNRVSIDLVGSLSQYHPQDKYLAYLRAERRKSEYKTREKAEEVTDLDFFKIVGGLYQKKFHQQILVNNDPVVRIFKILCPVDIEVYASDGMLVGRVANNIASDIVEDEIYVYVEGDKKYVGFIGEDTYLIKMTGTDAGTMEYAVQEVDTSTFKIVTEKSFENVILMAGKQMTSRVSVWDKEDTSINTGDKIDIPEVQLLVLDDNGNAVKEVLPDGEGTEVPYTEPTDPSDILPEDLPADGKIPDDLWIAGVKDSYTYTGTAIKPEIRVYDGKTRLQPGKDYTASYKNNIKVNNAAKTSTAPTITVKGKGNYAGTETATFQITAVDLSDSVVLAEDITVAYNKKVQKKVPVVTYNGKKLAANRDFTVSYPDGGDGAYKEAGIYDILLTAKSGGNFTGTRTVKCTITENTLLSKVSVKKIPVQVYTGEAIEPELAVTFKGAPLVKDTDYSVSYTDNTEIGTAKAILTGIGKYAGTKNVSFSITGTSLKSATVSGIENKIYNGCEQKQRLTVMLNGKALTEGTDYDVLYEKNKDVGKANVTIKGKGAYTGTIKKTFTIGKYNVAANADGRFEVTLKQDVVPYAKGGAKPGVTVRFKTGDEKWETLTEGQDYTLSYRNHTAVNDGSNRNKQPVVTLKGKGSFSGTYGTVLTYKIVAQDMGQLKLMAQDKTYQNKKNIYTTKITITDLDGKVLKPGTDYNKDLTYSYANGTPVNKNDIIPAGTILKVQAEAKSGGNYTGTLTGEYRMTQAAIASASVSVPKQIYTGRAITLEKNQITVKIKGKRLDESQYEIVPGSYKNNVKKGTATVTIRGLDNYGGTKAVKFTIKAKGFLWWWR